MSHLYLPRINPGAGIAIPDTPAVWIDNDRRIIKDISDGIAIDESANTREVSSIPDIYARPLTFLSALKSDNHPLRQRTIQEWRGLISLLALHKFNSNLDRVTITPVPLGDETFSRALKNLAPTPIQLEKSGTQYRWTDILLIRYDDIPLGAFSPGTLVFTSADYHQQLRSTAFPLMDENGYLKAPDKGDGIEFVGEWLEWFKREYNQLANTRETHHNKDYEYAGILNAHVESWISEIRRTLGIGVGEDIHSEDVNISEAPLEIASSAFLPKYHIYQLLLRPLVKNTDYTGAGNKSDYALSPKRNCSEYKEIVVITASELAKDKRLWEVTKPSQLNKDTVSLLTTFFKEASGIKINNVNLEINNAIWVRPEMYFLSDILLDSENKQILSASEQMLNGGNTRFVLPFRKEILHFFSPEDIQEVLKPRFELSETGDKVTFYFYLPLVGGTSVEVKKLYRAKGNNTGEGVIRSIKVPVLDIFPDYLGDFWSQYFVFSGDRGDYRYTPVNYRQSGVQQEPLRKTQTASQFSGDIIKVSGYDCFPEAIEIINANTQNIAGLVLISRKPENPDSKPDMTPKGRPFRDECTIGVDFGTSNTNVFIKVGNSSQRVDFEFSKYKRRLFASNETDSEKISQLFFVPDHDVKLPVPTALKAYLNGVHNDLLLDYFIYFPHAPKYPENVYTGIKWEGTIDRTEAFLKSLIFLLLAKIIRERYSRVTIKCTFPKSFSLDKQNAFKMCWNNLLMGIFYAEGRDSFSNQVLYGPAGALSTRGDQITIDTANGTFTLDTNPEFIYEGIAAGEYFSLEGISNPIADKARGAVCIDIGGGTTDYSVWLDDEIVFDTSVKLAGDILSKFLSGNARARGLLFSKEAVDSLNEAVKDPNEESFKSRLNYILKNEEGAILKQLGANANDPDIIGLRKLLIIQFSALATYAAHICLVVNQQKQKKLAENFAFNGIRLHWGGNAAKLINWIDHGRFTKEGTAAGFLNRAFYRALTDSELTNDIVFGKIAELEQVLSSGHKDEAAGGAVYSTSGSPAKTGESSGAGLFGNEDWDTQSYKTNNGVSFTDNWPGDEKIILGEKIYLKNDGVYEHYRSASVSDIIANDQVMFVRSDLSQLGKLLYFINGYGASIGLFNKGEFNLSQSDYREIDQVVLRNIYNLAREQESERVLEPVFIYEIRELIRRTILKYK